MDKTPEAKVDHQVSGMDAEQLPAGQHELHGAGHFAGLYAAENVAGTEFVFGATFVILGAGIVDTLIGLAVGNALAVLSYRFITTPIATRTRLSVYTYLDRIAGGLTSRLFNAANAIIFAVISAAMITVSTTALRRVFGFPEQAAAYPTNWGFVVIVVLFGCVAVLVAAFGFNALAEFASICGPWLMVMFVTGGIVLLPTVAETVTGSTKLNSWHEFVHLGGTAIFTGQTPGGGSGIGLLGIIGYSWAANSFAHFGLIDMSLFRYAKKNWYGYMSGTGMFLGHYVAWISAGFMGAATAEITKTSITVVEPGDVAFQALGYAGYATVVVGGWTTANANLYRAGLAGQGIFPKLSRQRVTLIVGLVVLAASAFPFIYRSYLSLVTYAGLLLVPVGGIIFAEHYILPRIGLTRFWARYKGVENIPALLAWGISLVVVGVPSALDIIPAYFAFPPAWLIATFLYTLLARYLGAATRYPTQETNDELFQERVDVFHAEQAARTTIEVDTKDRRKFTRTLKMIWVATLIVIVVDALFTLFSSPNSSSYATNRDRFLVIATVGTAIYFVVAYWELRRRKAFTRQVVAKRPEQNPDQT